MLSVIGITLIVVGLYGNWVTRLYALKIFGHTLECLNKNNDGNNRINHNEISQNIKIIMVFSPLCILVGILILSYI